MLTAQSFIQFPVPGLGEKYWSLSGFPSHAFQSNGGAFLTVIFGQIFAYSAFNDSHFSSPGSVSALTSRLRILESKELLERVTTALAKP